MTDEMSSSRTKCTKKRNEAGHVRDGEKDRFAVQYSETCAEERV